MNPGEPPLVVPLPALDRTRIAMGGGKAASLGDMILAGFPVPAGFCVTTAAYAMVAAGSDIDPVIDSLSGVPAIDVARLEDLAAEARRALLSAPMPAAVADALARAYDALGDGASRGAAEAVSGAAVAVRSSATAEDLPDASFAGQQDTFLHILGQDALRGAVRHCWASLWTGRAVAYRARNGIDHRAVQLAVVVQRMVRATVAGVLFTADPVTGARRRAVIDASPGLGEAVVSGAVNPDHFEVDATSGAILTRRLGDKQVSIEAAPGGGTRRVLREGAGAEPCLSDDEIRALMRLGAAVESHYGAPQDIEWALDEERKIWLLQARPITTLFPLPQAAPGADLRVYLNFNVAQGVPRPLTPMGLSAFRMASAGIAAAAGFPLAVPEAGATIINEAGGRMLLDLTPIARTAIGRRMLRFVFQRMEARSAAAMDPLLDDPRLTARTLPLRRFAPAVLGALMRTRVPLTIAQTLLRPEAAPGRCERAGDEALAFGDVTAGAGGIEARLAAIERLFYRGIPRIFVTCAPSIAAGFLSIFFSRWLLDGLAEPHEIDTVLRALPHNPTTEMDLALWALAVEIHDEPELRALVCQTPPAELAAQYRRGALPPRLLSGLAGFLRRYGARGVAEIDIGVARWGEDPAHLFGSLANYLAAFDGAIAPDAQFRSAAKEAEAAALTLGRRARARGRLRGRAASLFLRRVRQLAGLREAPKFHLVRLLARGRGLLLEIGQDLCATGRLDAADDVFMLRFSEVRAAGRGADLRKTAAARRAEYERERLRRHVPRILLSDGTDLEAAVTTRVEKAGVLSGTPASAGIVTARARVILDPIGAKLDPGEILVAPSTDPGWTPLFLTAGGLVMEMGGSMSHGAVVAREVGIPAIVGVPRATERIQTGQTITVDGARGTIALQQSK